LIWLEFGQISRDFAVFPMIWQDFAGIWQDFKGFGRKLFIFSAGPAAEKEPTHAACLPLPPLVPLLRLPLPPLVPLLRLLRLLMRLLLLRLLLLRLLALPKCF
jgi:hypothetical protein